MKNICLAFLVGALGVACSTSTPAPDFSASSEATVVWNQLSEFIKADMSRNDITGLSIAVSNSEGTLWARGFGKSDPAVDRPFTVETISNEGSVSKLITATAVMKLVEEGKVELDAPVSRYLAEFAPKTRFPEARAITVRDLMTHHSGLPSDYLQGFMPRDILPPGYPDSFRQNAALASGLYLTNPPGKAFSYSNLAVSLLGEIVTRVSGKPFEAFCQSEVLLPLGMPDSSFLLPLGFETNPRYARGPLQGRSSPVPYIRDLPAGALNSTALDMARFASSYLASYRNDKGLLRQASVQQMFTVQNPAVEADVGFQIGLNFWMVPMDQLPGEKLVGHGGDLDPFHALLLLMPERDLAVNIQVNSAGGIGSFTLADIAAQALRAAAKTTGQSPMAPVAAKAPPKTLLPTDQARLTGNYSSALGVLRLRPQGQGLQVNLMGQWLEGLPRSDGTIGLEAKVLGLKLPIALLETIALREAKVDGKPALALLIGSLPYGSAVKIEPEPVSAVWKARLGDYKVSKPTPGDVADAARLFVDAETGLLMFSVRAFGQSIALPIHEISDTQAITVGYGRNLGETLVADENGFHFGGLTFVKK